MIDFRSHAIPRAGGFPVESGVYPPLFEPITPDVDSPLKQFAQSSQLGSNAAYIEDLYEQYLVAPDSVGPQWKAWFDGFKGREAGDIPHSAIMENVAAAGRQATRGVVAHGAGDERERHVGRLITAYRSRGPNGRASGRERVWQSVKITAVARSFKNKKHTNAKKI